MRVTVFVTSAGSVSQNGKRDTITDTDCHTKIRLRSGHCNGARSCSGGRNIVDTSVVLPATLTTANTSVSHDSL